MYNLIFAKSFLKDLKRLSPEVQRVFSEKWSVLIADDPFKGKSFVGKRLKGYYKLSIRYKRTDYRIVYVIKRKKVEVLLLAMGPRENFYKRLDR